MIESGVTHLIFDLRLVFDDFQRQIRMLAEEVIPVIG